jgi:RNase adapter protein RapZ
MKELNTIIISGLSGSGKTTALKTLEDLDFFCVDNLPIMLLPKLIELCNRSADTISRVALGMDAREGEFLKEFLPTLEKLRIEGHLIELIFLESSDEMLLRRFSETRRNHPLCKDGMVREGITRERQMLSQVKKKADKVIDTSTLNVHQLRALFQEYFNSFSLRQMSLTFLSFGFKYGVPHDSDLVLDVRFMANPFFVPELKPLSGNDQAVAGYVMSTKENVDYLAKVQDLLSFSLPLFEREGKAYLTVAIGCTGGRHRSVAVANYFKDLYAAQRDRVFAVHRDVDR